MNIDTRNNIISAVLMVLIVFLSWLLYDSIKGPYEAEQARKKVTEHVRHRMSNVRNALILYQNQNPAGKFPTNLDELMAFIQGSEHIMAKADSLFAEMPPRVFSIDSLVYSPRTGKRFYYSMIDSIRPNLYVLRDPDSKDVIGDSVKTTLLNAANWE